jgi:hypothetical protein
MRVVRWLIGGISAVRERHVPAACGLVWRPLILLIGVSELPCSEYHYVK